MALAHNLGFPHGTDSRRSELCTEQLFAQIGAQLVDEVEGKQIKPRLIGPLTYLWQGKVRGDCDKLELLEDLLPLYGQLLQRLSEQGVEWVQLDEPILTLDLPQEWKNAFERAYNLLQKEPVQKLIATHSADLGGNLGLAVSLPVDGLHIDRVSSPEQLSSILDRLPSYKVLSLGTDPSDDQGLTQALLCEAHVRLGSRLWLATLTEVTQQLAA